MAGLWEIPPNMEMLSRQEKEFSMAGQEHKNLAASCGLYCGACSVYIAGKMGDSKRLEQVAGRLAEHLGRVVEVRDPLTPALP